MLLIRGFSPPGFANWALFIVIFSIFEAVKQGLLRNPTIKFLSLPEYADKKTSVQSSSLIINVLFSLLFVLLILFFSGTLSRMLHVPQLEWLLRWSILLVLLLIPFLHCEIILQANFQFSKIFKAHFVRQAIFFGGVLILFFFFREHFTLLNILALQITGLVAGAILMYFFSFPYLNRFQYNFPIVVGMFHFGKFIFGTNLFSQLARSLDHFITANLLSPVNARNYVSYYNSISRINNMVDIPSLAAADVLFPKNVETLQTQGIQKVKYYFEKMVATILAVIIPISLFIFIFPKFTIWIVAGPEYYPAIPILQFTILFSLIRPVSYQFGSTLDAIGKPEINFQTNCWFLVISIIMNYIFIKAFGGMGAAYAMAINYSILLIIMIIVSKKYLQVELINIYRFMIEAYAGIFRRF